MSGSPETGAAGVLRDELRRLHEAVAYWSPSRWERAARGVDGARRAADVVDDLVRTLAALGEAAGSGAPPGRLPERTGVHALADQLAVVAGELLAGPELPDVLDRARAAVAAARTELFG